MKITRLWAAGAGIMAILLVACAEKPEPRTVYVKVDTPVLVPCRVTMPDKPVFAVDVLKLGQPIDVQMRALRADRLQRRAYELKLEAAIEACR